MQHFSQGKKNSYFNEQAVHNDVADKTWNHSSILEGVRGVGEGEGTTARKLVNYLLLNWI